MKISPINYVNFNAKLKDRASKNNDDNTEIKLNDGTMPYGADVQITKTDSEGNISSEYFKDGVYIVHETISAMKHSKYPYEENYQEIDVFDRQLGEHTSKRRYDNGKTDILRKGRWDGKNFIEIEHQDKDGNTTGYTRREYQDYSLGKPYWGYDYYCLGDIYFRYFQTKFDKNHEPIGAFEGLEKIPGKKIKSL